jgi:hypothetical protein
MAAAANVGVAPSASGVPPIGKSIPSFAGTEVATVPPKRSGITKQGILYSSLIPCRGLFARYLSLTDLCMSYLIGDQPGGAQEASGGMNSVLMAPFSTPSSAWEGFQSPLIKFQHGDFFTKGGASAVKVSVTCCLVFSVLVSSGSSVFNPSAPSLCLCRNKPTPLWAGRL